MNKIKKVKRGNTTFFVVKGQKGQQIDVREAEALSMHEVAGLLPVDILQKKAGFTLRYNITGYKTLSTYFRTSLHKEDFSRLLAGAVEVFQNVQAAYFNYRNLAVQPDTVLLNPSTHALAFLYIPIQGYDNNTSQKDLFAQLAHKASFSPEEDLSYVKQYFSLFNSSINFSLFDMEKYIAAIRPQDAIGTAEGGVLCPKCGKTNAGASSHCIFCNHPITTVSGSLSRVYNPALGAVTSATQPPPATATPFQNASPPAARTEATPLQSQRHAAGKTATHALQADTQTGGTSVLGIPTPAASRKAFLLRSGQNTSFPIDTELFRMGRHPGQNEMVIGDNPAVSSNHAHIVQRAQRFYIIDNHSTNKTYLNGVPLAPGQEQELFSPAEIKLGDEIILFQIEDQP